MSRQYGLPCADDLARGIVAAARVLGVHPELAVTAKSGTSRKAATAAAIAVADIYGISERRAGLMLGLRNTRRRCSSARGQRALDRAIDAARRAIQW